MKLKRKDKPSGDVDLTAFSDLAFLLIVFFVLTTTFLRPEGASLSIPSQTSDPSEKPTHEIPRIYLSSDRVMFDNKPTTVEGLRQNLFKMNFPSRVEDQRVVILESTSDVPFERYYRIVTAISKAGGVLAIVESDEGEKDS